MKIVQDNSGLLLLTQNYSKVSEKLKTLSGKCRVNMVTWSFLPFAFCRKRDA